MEMNRETISCLDPVLQEVRAAELTQQIRLTDAMPDIGRILASWGQVILRGKQWQEGEAIANGGVMVWVLYAPEDGSEVRCMDSWIPFRMRWELPEDIPEGHLRVRCLLRFLDSRSVSPRKIMVRCGVSALAEACVPSEREVAVPAGDPDGVELLQSTYPLRLPVEAGEKPFLLDEELILPESAPQPEKLIYSRMEPRIIDCRVLGDKLAFRGSGNLHMLYRSDEGQLHSWDFPVPFSQIAELEREYGADAQADLAPAVTGLEAELDDEGHMRLKGGITAQYRITDRQMVSLAEDAYDPGRELNLQRDNLELPVVLENRRENLYAEQTIPMDANVAADVSFLPDFPRQKRGEQGVELTYPGTFQVLFYGPDGALQSANARWEGRQMLKADEDSRLAAVPMAQDPQALMGAGQMQVKAELPVEITATARQQIPMITAVEPGQPRKADPQRPTLILRRAGEDRLWDIAKGSGSRVEDIRRANGLQGEPVPGQMLLIPVR